MEIKTLNQITRYFEETVDDILSKQGGERVWLKGVGKMVHSKMNLDLILEDLNLFSKYTPNGTILDFGAGSGHISLLLANMGYETKATDINNYAENGQNVYNKMMVEDQLKLWGAFSRCYNNLSFTHYKNVTPYKDGTFDAVMAYAVLEHVPVGLVSTVLKELKRVLKPEGILYISRLPRRLSLSEFIARHLNMGYHEKLYWDKEAQEVLTNSGFAIVEKAYEEAVPAYPETVTNKLFPVLKVYNKLLLKTPLRVFSHHLRFVCKKI